MQILAFNASPNRTKGNTHRILMPFLEGAVEAGATAETLMVRDLEVKPCTACFTCWLKTPEKCVQKDDMADVLLKARQADVMVLGTPLYVDGMVGALKVILDRMIPLVHPEFEMRDGHMRHPAVEGRTIPKMVLISVCGLHEMDNFDALVAHVQAMCRNMSSEYAGALLRPHAYAMGTLEKFGSPATSVTDACREAGRQIVTDGKMDPAVLDRVSEDLMPLEMYFNGANDIMHQAKVKSGIA